MQETNDQTQPLKPGPHTARKRFGQNFLQDPTVIDQIVHAIGPKAGDHLVEIGPGQAALTHPVAAKLGADSRLDLLEIDRDLAAQLEQHFANNDKVTVQQIDALEVDFTALAQQQQKSLRVFGNLPYNISTPLIFHLLQQTASQLSSPNGSAIISDMHFMLQREVVERMAAPPGNKTYGRLSIMTQYYCQVEALFEVPPEAFSPQPKVMSAIVRLMPYKQPPLLAKQPEILDKIVKAAFSQRRKTLRNGLKPYISAAQLEALGINPAVRAETLAIESFVDIANALAQ